MSRDSWDDYRGDAFYEAWRSGRNPDAVDVDRLHDCYYDGCSVEAAVTHALPRRHDPEPDPADQWAEEDRYAERVADAESDEWFRVGLFLRGFFGWE